MEIESNQAQKEGEMMNDQTVQNFYYTYLELRKMSGLPKDYPHVKETILGRINSHISSWSNGNWSIRLPKTPEKELVADLIFKELEENRSDGWQRFSVSDFLENWDDFVVQEGCDGLIRVG